MRHRILKTQYGEFWVRPQAHGSVQLDPTATGKRAPNASLIARSSHTISAEHYTDLLNDGAILRNATWDD